MPRIEPRIPDSRKTSRVKTRFSYDLNRDVQKIVVLKRILTPFLKKIFIKLKSCQKLVLIMIYKKSCEIVVIRFLLIWSELNRDQLPLLDNQRSKFPLAFAKAYLTFAECKLLTEMLGDKTAIVCCQQSVLSEMLYN